jgi:hypothetical protein
MGELAKGGAVVNRPGTRVDGYSRPREKKLVLQACIHTRTWVGGKQGVQLNEASIIM